MYEEITVKDYIMNNNYEMVICYAIWYNKNSLIMRRDKHNEKEVDRNRCYKNTVCDTDFVFSLGRTWNRKNEILDFYKRRILKLLPLY